MNFCIVLRVRSSDGIPCLKTAAGAGTIGAEHVVGTIDSVLRTGRSFYRMDGADIIPIVHTC